MQRRRFHRLPVEISLPPFFVWERGKDKIRLVMDARVPNRRFRRSPPMAMGSGTTWSRGSLNPGADLYVGQCDIQDCFYNLELEANLGVYFSLPPVDATILDELGVPYSRGRGKTRGGKTWAFMRRVPMGWSWAFWLVQRAHAYQAMLASGLPTSRFVTDDSPVPSLAGGEPIALPQFKHCWHLGRAGR